MRSKRLFLLTLGTSFFVYFILYLVTGHYLYYLVNGAVGGTIREALKIFELNSGAIPVICIWTALLMLLIALYYLQNCHFLNFFLLIIIAFLLNIIDLIISLIPLSEKFEMHEMRLIDFLVIVTIISFKSASISFLVVLKSHLREKGRLANQNP